MGSTLDASIPYTDYVLQNSTTATWRKRAVGRQCPGAVDGNVREVAEE
jgi:hypothetical protein